MEREERVALYQQQAGVADDLVAGGKVDEAVGLLKLLEVEARVAGDVDYQAFFAAEQIGYLRGDYRAAGKVLMKGLEEARKAGLRPDSVLLRNVGSYLIFTGKLDAALGWYDKALAENPRDSRAMRGKGALLSLKGDDDAAIKWYDKAIAEDPRDWVAMRSKGVSLSKKGNDEAAIEWFDKALAENPKDWDAMRGKGVALFNRDDPDQAIEWLGRAAKGNRVWEKGFRDACKAANRDPDVEWRRIAGVS